MAEKFIPSENPTLSLSVNQDNELVAPTAEELLSANPALGILQERTQNMSASPSGTSIEKGLTVSGNLQFSDSISNKPTEIEAPNTVQVKGYFIQYFDKTNFSNGTGTMDIYVGDEELTYEQGIENQSSPASTFYNAGLDTQYEVGDLISFRNKYSFICGGQITAISGNKITLGQFTDFVLEQMPTTTTWLPDKGADQTELNFDAYSLWNMNRPTLGSVVLNNISFAFGANLNSLGKASFAQGFDSNAYGAYSIATGRGTTAGSYAQFVCGRNNAPDYNQKLLFIVGGGWGSDLKNVCTVDYGGNLVLAAGSSPQPSETASITATNGHFSGSIDVESSVSVGSVELTEESLQETQDNVSALQTSVTSITSKTQNQSATSGNTSFTGNLTVNGTISTGSMSDIVGKVKQNQSAISETQTDVSTLSLSKLSAGTLYFNGGTATNSTFAPLVPFSAVATVVFAGGASKILTIGNAILSVGTDGKLTLTDGTHSATSTTTITQGVPVPLTMIVKGTTALVYAGTTQVLSVTSFAWSGSGITVGESGNTIIASRIAVFNFDLSASGVLYSVSDYANGKEIPPMMFSQQQYFDSSSNWTAWKPSNYSIDKSNGIKVTITNAYSSSYALLRITGLPAFMAGTIAQVSYESLEQTVSSDYAMTPDFCFVGTQGQSDKTPLTDSGTTYIAKAKYDSNEIRITLQFPAVLEFTEGTYIQLNGVKVIINGLLIKLGDYTIKRNATTKLIKDESGHGLDATVSAGVCGTKDATIATFVDEIKTQINQSNG